MVQVPFKSFLIVGDGRLATHFAFYFKAKNLKLNFWSRKKEDQKALQQKIRKSDYILLCLPDSQIPLFYNKHFTKPPDFGKNTKKNKEPPRNKRVIHFSGSLFHPDILGFHPLMTFDLKNYDLKTYEEIPFVGVHRIEAFKSIFGQLKNPYIKIKKEDQPLYHSLCVLAGNGTTLLWDLAGQNLEKLGLEDQHIKPYLKKVFDNIQNKSPGRWSGPWYRGDQKTIEKNKKSLEDISMKSLYENFLELSKQTGHYK